MCTVAGNGSAEIGDEGKEVASEGGLNRRGEGIRVWLHPT
jgi:hypothetical protein